MPKIRFFVMGETDWVDIQEPLLSLDHFKSKLGKIPERPIAKLVDRIAECLDKDKLDTITTTRRAELLYDIMEYMSHTKGFEPSLLTFRDDDEVVLGYTIFRAKNKNGQRNYCIRNLGCIDFDLYVPGWFYTDAWRMWRVVAKNDGYHPNSAAQAALKAA